MLINTENGTVELAAFNTFLQRGMLLADLQQTDFYKSCYHHMWDVKTGYFWYYFNPITVEGSQLCFHLCFLEDRLNSIHMNTREETDARNWDEWTEEKKCRYFTGIISSCPESLQCRLPGKVKHLTRNVRFIFRGGISGQFMIHEAQAVSWESAIMKK